LLTDVILKFQWSQLKRGKWVYLKLVIFNHVSLYLGIGNDTRESNSYYVTNANRKS